MEKGVAPGVRRVPRIEMKPKRWAIARQHPAETCGSWMAEGMLDWLLVDSSEATELRRMATV